MKIFDTSGQQCPAPLIATKRALRESATGESVKVITDNQNSFNNISRFLKDNNAEFTSEESNGVWTLTIRKVTSANANADPSAYCTNDVPHFTQGDFIIAFSSDKMGDGDAELGHLLMSNFIKAILDLDILPRKMVFYNRGVTLGSEDSPVAGKLREIEKMGVGLLLCATCAKHYSIEEKIKIGTMSNMFEIVQVMSSTGNIIRP
ncbi:MAG TPA: sulfurtransferase-like selenium metabolism protein YedF [Bacteroidales bacterium]|jgi:selenium metabolism protein YedF|nr:sulfurtransferase-like selenium metabolism protein YedF [Bacteroidales bacterium]HBZ20781.1 sulfurtransferase-like selenium metabolism protein YedF [Bacteroidales bacterium]